MTYHREIECGYGSEPCCSAGLSVERLYLNYRHMILRHLMRLVGERETAEDLCQETFIKAWRGWAKRDPQASATAWLYRIATNTAYDYLRRRRRIVSMPLYIAETIAYDAEPMESLLESGETFRAALARLPEHYRVPLALHVYAGYTMRDISQTLGCTDSAAKTRICRARKRFREAYTK